MRYQLKTACRDGTMYVALEQPDFIAGLAALAPNHKFSFLDQLSGISSQLAFHCFPVDGESWSVRTPTREP